MNERTIPTWGELRERRSKNLWELGRLFSGDVWAAHEAGSKLSNTQMYMLDLFAESLCLAISETDEIWENYFEGFCYYLSSGDCSQVDYAMTQAEFYYIEQFMAEPDKERDGERFYLRCQMREDIASLKEELGKSEADDLSVAELANSLLGFVGPYWETSVKIDRFGKETPIDGRKSDRERDEKFKNIQLPEKAEELG